MAKEASARIKINKLLEASGWRFFDNHNGKANVVLEQNTTIAQSQLNEFGDNFEKTSAGFLDYLLLDEKGYPLIVLEAKKEEADPLLAKEKSRKYAQSQNCRFIILSNGNLHYFWDIERGNPTIITAFPTQDSIQPYKASKPNPFQLINETIEADYVVLTQNPNYKSDPLWIDELTRSDYNKQNSLKFLRPYQVKAVQSIQKSVASGNERFLFEMATGTGKTLIAGAVIRLFLRTGNANRVLFLVDRLELEDQAWKNFVKYLKNDFKTVIYKEQRNDWRKAEIVVTTVQSLMFNNKYKKLFSPTDFDLVISDEAHRSIGGNARAVFEYFVGYKLGLTATPRDYLKKIDSAKFNQKDHREFERRMLLDTYKTFGCEGGQPTFRYSLLDGVKDKFLINPVVIDARTEITTQLLSDKGYAVMVENEEGKEEEQIFLQRDFEKKFFSDETNKIFCQTFLDHALRDPISKEIGKTVIFCVSVAHASKITQFLNEFAHQLFPGKYNSDFALQITSKIENAQQFTINFSNNNLSGHTNFIAGYDSSKTRVCVTVGMMTTGYDCEDLLNLCLMRPIFSPTDFIQMKGRGTRKFNFAYKSKNEFGEYEITESEKNKFKLFDFFANCEYFEEKFNYDEVLKLPVKASSKPGEGTKYIVPEDFENQNPDPLKTFNEQEIGEDGMKIDRMFFDRFEEKIKQDEFSQRQYAAGNFDALEDHVRQELFDKPEEYFNMEKLRKAIGLDRRISLREIIEKIFGGISYFKNKDELLEDEFDKFVSIYKPEGKYIIPIKNFLKAYISDPEVREIVDSGKYPLFATKPIKEDFKALNNEWRKIIPEYVKDYVPLNKFIQ